MRVVSLLNSGADISTTKQDRHGVCFCQYDKHIHGVQVQCMHVDTRGSIHFPLCSMYTCTCRAYVNCGHVVYSGQDVVQCTSIVGAVASAAVSSDGSYSH